MQGTLDSGPKSSCRWQPQKQMEREMRDSGAWARGSCIDIGNEYWPGFRMRVVGCSCDVELWMGTFLHTFLCSFFLFFSFFLGNCPKDEYIEVLKKNAVECGKGTLQAFSDQRWENMHRTHATGWGVGEWTREGVKRVRTQNKMNVICGRGNARQRAYWSVEVESQPREWASTIERDGRALARPGVGNPGNREHCATDVASTSRWARPTEVVSAVRHWMTINFHLIGFIWNSYFSFSLPLILSSISISITLPCWLPAFPSSHSLYPRPNYLSHFSMTAVVFTAVAWHLLQILFCFFLFYCF